jgi:hypothetical protein
VHKFSLYSRVRTPLKIRILRYGGDAGWRKPRSSHMEAELKS